MHRRLAQDQSVDSTTSRNSGETHSHLTRACLEHNAELRKTNAALGRGKQNASLFYNPDQDVRMTTQGDFEYLLEHDGLKRINTQIQRRSERQEEHLNSKIQTCVLIP